MESDMLDAPDAGIDWRLAGFDSWLDCSCSFW